ncbi:unnamed protein product, partial [Allacma fusca]
TTRQFANLCNWIQLEEPSLVDIVFAEVTIPQVACRRFKHDRLIRNK